MVIKELKLYGIPGENTTLIIDGTKFTEEASLKLSFKI